MSLQEKNCEQKAYREKYWSEIGDGEKIKRLRDQVKGLQRDINRFRKHLAALRYHSHLEGGRIVIPLGNQVDEFIDRQPQDGDDVYF